MWNMHGWWVVMPVAMIAFWVLVIWCVVLLARRFPGPRR
jgi:hypothetical protein